MQIHMKCFFLNENRSLEQNFVMNAASNFTTNTCVNDAMDCHLANDALFVANIDTMTPNGFCLEAKTIASWFKK